MTTYYILIVASLLLFAPTLWAYSDGAPSGACFDMTPQHHGILAQEGNSSYIILASPSTQRPGYPIRVTLQATKNDELIKGFMVQARVGMTPIGLFRPLDAYSHTLDCGNGKKNTLTHNKLKGDGISRVEFEWVAPRLSGRVNIEATVALNGGVFWVGQLIAPVYIVEN